MGDAKLFHTSVCLLLKVDLSLKKSRNCQCYESWQCGETAGLKHKLIRKCVKSTFFNYYEVLRGIVVAVWPGVGAIEIVVIIITTLIHTIFAVQV